MKDPKLKPTIERLSLQINYILKVLGVAPGSARLTLTQNSPYCTQLGCPSLPASETTQPPNMPDPLNDDHAVFDPAINNVAPYDAPSKGPAPSAL
jgi:hypothetical protein